MPAAEEMDFSDEIQNFPFLTKEEFSEACHYLDSQYRRATLGRLRQRWKLRVCTVLESMDALDASQTTYIQIMCPLDPATSDEDISLDLKNFSITEDAELEEALVADNEMADAEASDQAILSLTHVRRETGNVLYEIHLHPTYRLPCLWFTLHGLPLDEPAFSIDTVFRHLVPDEFKEGLRSHGAIGGISADHHPVTGIPTFFVHPCLIGDAISGFNCSKKNYLMIWLGLAGGCVGLWVPKEMGIE